MNSIDMRVVDYLCMLAYEPNSLIPEREIHDYSESFKHVTFESGIS